MTQKVVCFSVHFSPSHYQQQEWRMWLSQCQRSTPITLSVAESTNPVASRGSHIQAVFRSGKVHHAAQNALSYWRLIAIYCLFLITHKLDEYRSDKMDGQIAVSTISANTRISEWMLQHHGIMQNFHNMIGLQNPLSLWGSVPLRPSHHRPDQSS